MVRYIAPSIYSFFEAGTKRWSDGRPPPPPVTLLISKFLVGRKTSEVVENADESGFGEGQDVAGARASFNATLYPQSPRHCLVVLDCRPFPVPVRVHTSFHVRFDL